MRSAISQLYCAWNRAPWIGSGEIPTLLELIDFPRPRRRLFIAPSRATSGSSDFDSSRFLLFHGGTSRSGNRADQLESLAEGEFMANLKGLASIVSELRVERTNLANQLKRVDAALSVLGKLNGGSSDTKPRRTLSASARRRISLAQKARWAKRAANDQAGKMKPKRTMSASARRKIAAAQRARWAKVRAKKAA